jgi:hypothetical protein
MDTFNNEFDKRLAEISTEPLKPWEELQAEQIRAFEGLRDALKGLQEYAEAQQSLLKAASGLADVLADIKEYSVTGKVPVPYHRKLVQDAAAEVARGL